MELRRPVHRPWLPPPATCATAQALTEAQFTGTASGTIGGTVRLPCFDGPGWWLGQARVLRPRRRDASSACSRPMALRVRISLRRRGVWP